MDAREIVSLLKLDDCPRRFGLAKQGIKPKQLKEYAGLSLSEEESTFAMRKGIAFEDRIIAKNATILRNQYRFDKNLEIKEINVVVIDNKNLSSEQIVEQTKKIITEHTNGEGFIILGAMVGLELDSKVYFLKPDFIVYDGSWRIGEIKSYSYEANLTNPHRIFSASAQACLYAIALRQQNLKVDLMVDLVFQQPRDLEVAEGEKQKYLIRPKIKTIAVEDVDGMFSTLQKRLQRAQPLEIEDAEKAAFKPCLGCLNSCPLWVKCQRQMKDADKIWGFDPAITSDPEVDKKSLDQNPTIEFGASLLHKQV